MVTFFDNFILGIALALPLGPVTLEILRRGLKNGFYDSLKTMSGAFSAELTYFTLVYLGLARFSESFIVKVVLGFLGVFFLLYLGFENILDFFRKSSAIRKKDISKNSFVAGYLITFLNPSNFFMWAGIIGGFFAQNTSLLVSSGVLLGIFISLFSVAVLSKVGNNFLDKSKMRYISLIAGMFLAYYGLRLLYKLII